MRQVYLSIVTDQMKAVEHTCSFQDFKDYECYIVYTVYNKPKRLTVFCVNVDQKCQTAASGSNHEHLNIH